MYSLNKLSKYLFKCIMIFQSSMDPRKLRCDTLNGTIQGWACSLSIIKKSSMDSGTWKWFYNIKLKMYESWEVTSIFFSKYMQKNIFIISFFKINSNILQYNEICILYKI
jgi:hypothetical protein